MSQALTSFLNGCGNTRLPLYSDLAALPVNVGLGVALIHGHFGTPVLGLVGATHVCALIHAGPSLDAFAAIKLILPWILMAGTVGMSQAQATGILVAQRLGQQCRFEVPDRFLAAAWRAVFRVAALAVHHFDLPAFRGLSILLPDAFVKAPACHLRLFRGDWKAREIPA